MSEHREQCALFAWAEHARKRLPELGQLFAIPNGGARDKRTGAMLKAEGVKAGVPDVCLPVARHGFHALYIEMKYGKNTVQKHQIEWHHALEYHGNMVVVCYGWEAARRTLEDYLSL